jgi:DNA polymerase elongation subunit (family B)
MKLLPTNKSSTKILLYDLETAPNTAFVWGKWETNVLSYINEGYLLSFAYKWLGDKGVKSFALPDFKGYKRNKANDFKLVKVLYDLMNQADIVIAHNADGFDIKKSNARFLYYGLKPPVPFKSVDTLKVARKYFKLNSNSLDDLGKYLGIGEKVKTGGFDLWKGCINGDMKAWKKMIDYNKNDVALLEKVYLTLLPWIKNHPNINIVDEVQKACPNCGSTKLQKRGIGVNILTKHQRFQCMSCGHWCQSKPIQVGLEIR